MQFGIATGLFKELISKVVEIDDAGGREGVSFQLEKITPIKGKGGNMPWQHHIRRRTMETIETRHKKLWKPMSRKEHVEC